MATDPIQAEEANVLQQAEQIASEAENAQERSCPLCDQSLGEHQYDICRRCFETKLALCTDCGKRTGRKGEYDFELKRQHSLCIGCKHHRDDRPRMEPTASNAQPTKADNTRIYFWDRLAKAAQTLDSVRVFNSPTAMQPIERLLVDAETACDLEELEKCDKLLRRFHWEKVGFDLTHELADFSYTGQEGEERAYILEGWARARYMHAFELYDAHQYRDGFVVMRDLYGLADYEIAENQRLGKLNRQALELSRHLKRKADERTEQEAKLATNREARLAYLAQQIQTVTPVPVPTQKTSDPSRHTYIDDRECENCGASSRYRFCIDCHHRLPMCPTCNERKVFVDKNGNPMPNCLDCFLATRQEEPKQKDTSKQGGKGKNKK